MGITTDLACRSVFVYLSRLRQSKMSFHQALDLIFELDEAEVRYTRDILRQRDCLDRLTEIPWVVLTFVVIEGESCDGIDMVIKNLDFEPKIDAMMRDFLEVLRSFPLERIKQGNE
nr:hypothetical protein [Tanacetum cinerariifolium]